jgi:hypothetical protein
MTSEGLRSYWRHTAARVADNPVYRSVFESRLAEAILSNGLNDLFEPFSRGLPRQSTRSACRPPFRDFEGSSPMYRLSTSSGPEALRTWWS